MLTLIAAIDSVGAIGKDGKLPWHEPEDLRFFKKTTKGGLVIMGRKTWESLPVRPLPDRINMVITRDRSYFSGADIQEFSINGALVRAKELKTDTFCIGGAQIYEQMLPYASRVILSQFKNRKIEGADSFFPSLVESDWFRSAETWMSNECTRLELTRK